MKITRTDRRILAALEESGDMSPDEVADVLGLTTHGWAASKLRILNKAEIVRVSKWTRNGDGLATPTYSITPGKNAQRPKAEGWSVWSKRYRKNLQEKGGEQYLKAKNSLSLLINITNRRSTS